MVSFMLNAYDIIWGLNKCSSKTHILMDDVYTNDNKHENGL